MDGHNDVRNSLRKMRNANKGIGYTPENNNSNVSEGKHMTMREMLGKMRNIKEEDGSPSEKTITPLDKKREEEKIQKNFEDLQVNPTIEDFEVYDNGVFLSGSLDDSITFTFRVTPSETGSGVDWSATDDFDSENEENQKIIERLESYYDEFYKYWRNNELQI